MKIIPVIVYLFQSCQLLTYKRLEINRILLKQLKENNTINYSSFNYNIFQTHTRTTNFKLTSGYETKFA